MFYYISRPTRSRKVENFINLGASINNNGSGEEKVRRRIGRAKYAIKTVWNMKRSIETSLKIQNKISEVLGILHI